MSQEMLDVNVNESLEGNQESRGEEDENRIIKRVIERRNFLLNLPGRRVEMHDRITGIGQKLAEKYPDAYRCYLFHVLSHSGIDREKCTRFDFPGDDSIIKILEDLVREYPAE